MSPRPCHSSKREVKIADLRRQESRLRRQESRLRYRGWVAVNQFVNCCVRAHRGRVSSLSRSLPWDQMPIGTRDRLYAAQGITVPNLCSRWPDQRRRRCRCRSGSCRSGSHGRRWQGAMIRRSWVGLLRSRAFNPVHEVPRPCLSPAIACVAATVMLIGLRTIVLFFRHNRPLETGRDQRAHRGSVVSAGGLWVRSQILH
jgi:hypothetical protein